MFTLRFDPSKCADCDSHDCLTKCQYLKLDEATAKVEMDRIIAKEDSFVLHDCTTCYACEEYCQRGNHPFYLIVSRQEELNILPLPDPLVKRGVQMGIPFRGEPRIEKIQGPAINMGVFSPLANRIQGKLFENLGRISFDSRKMFHYFCQLMYLHYGRTSVINERLEKIIETIAAHEADYVVHFHDECYGTYTHYAPAFGIDVPFKSVHLFEFLAGRLKELQTEIRPLNFKVAYQRPCSSRLSSDKYRYVDEIFDLIGVDHVKRRYVGENALCCGATIMGQRKEGSRAFCLDQQRRNIADMKESGAQVCVFNCPACMETLGKQVAENGLMPVFMSDLCRMAIGEKIA
jgi:Fe-S oxidoreductase